jgi:tRNA-dihydrouridine synthase B
MLESLQIGGVTMRPATVLAPMAGITDTAFRRFILRMGGCGLLMTEFTSSDGIWRDSKLKAGRTKFSARYLAFTVEERPISAQLFGSDPRIIAEAARMCEDLGFDIIDLNLGCPVKKVVKCNGGSGLLRDLPVVETIFRAVRAAVKVPFTVKFRSGFRDREIVATQVARIAEDCGLDAVALHPRTREQGFGGKADWRYIAEIKQAVRIPVIGNGDIATPEDAARMLVETGCDAVMIGRAAASNPWIFRQIAQYRETGRYDHPTESDRYEMIRDYFAILVDENHPEAVGRMKQFASYFTHGVSNGSQLRRAIHDSREAAEIVGKVDAFFLQPAFSLQPSTVAS